MTIPSDNSKIMHFSSGVGNLLLDDNYITKYNSNLEYDSTFFTTLMNNGGATTTSFSQPPYVTLWGDNISYQGSFLNFQGNNT